MSDDAFNHANDNEGVQIGPDLNVSRSPLDKKLYRQILLPNGLRCVLISDTIAMRQRDNAVYDDDDDDESGCKSYESDGMNTDDGDDDESFEDEGDGLRQAAAAMVVGVGSYYDPPKLQGLAHFLEVSCLPEIFGVFSFILTYFIS